MPGVTQGSLPLFSRWDMDLGSIWGVRTAGITPPFTPTASCSSPRRAFLTRSPHPSPWSDPAWGSLHRRGSPRQLARRGGKLAAANMSDFWHKLGCCVVEKPQPVSSFSLASLGSWDHGLTRG